MSSYMFERIQQGINNRLLSGFIDVYTHKGINDPSSYAEAFRSSVPQTDLAQTISAETDKSPVDEIPRRASLK